MNKNQPVKKRDMPLSMLLLVAQIVVNYRNLLGLFTRIPSLARGGVFGIAYYLINGVTSVAPIIMLVLLFQYTANGKAVAKTISRLFCSALRWNPTKTFLGFLQNSPTLVTLWLPLSMVWECLPWAPGSAKISCSLTFALMGRCFML